MAANRCDRGFALIAALYLTVKRAVKDALKEYAKETRQG